MTCGNTESPSSTSCILPWRTTLSLEVSFGFQNVVSLTQYASFNTRSLKPKASNISMVRQAMPSAWPSSNGPDFRSTIWVLMSGKAASCAANVSPAGPQPMTSTSTSLGRLSELDDVLYCSDGSEISGLPVLNPLRWNCIGHFLRAAVRLLFLPKQQSY